MIASCALQVASGDWSYDHAHFKGVMRRLLVPSAEDYDDQEYEEAAEEFLSAMKQLVAHSRSAHNSVCMPKELTDRGPHFPEMPCAVCCQSA